MIDRLLLIAIAAGCAVLIYTAGWLASIELAGAWRTYLGAPLDALAFGLIYVAAQGISLIIDAAGRVHRP